MNIAIIIPVYNNLGTLPETLDSVLALEDRESVELVIADDASKDGTREYLEKWMAANACRFARCEFVRNEENLGISGNHARAFAAAGSEYGFYIGGDDVIYNPRIVAELRREILANPGLRIAKMDIEARYVPGNRIERIYRYKRAFFRMPARKQFASLALLGNFLYAGPGTVLHLPTLKRIGGFDARFRTYEDMPLFYSFLVRGYPMRFIKVRGIHWIRSSASLSLAGFSSNRGRYEQENLIREGIVKEHYDLLSKRERVIFEHKNASIVMRLMLLSTYFPWIRFRAIPSVSKRVFCHKWHI